MSYDDEGVDPPTLTAEQLKRQLLAGRKRLNSGWQHMPAESILDHLGEQYVDDGLIAAMGAIGDAYDNFFRLYQIALAREARDNAQRVIDSKTILIAELEAM